MACERQNSTFCPTPPPPSPDGKSEISEMLKNMGADIPCYRDKTSTVEISQTKSGGGTLFFGGGTSTTTSSERKNDISIGCDQLTAIANSYKSTVQNISCNILKSCNIQENSLSAIQSINVDCGGDITIGDINQNISAKLIASFNVSNDEIVQIESDTKSAIKDSLDILQNSTTGYLGTTQGQKLISDTKVKLDTINYKSTIKDNITEFNNSLSAGQYIDINGKKNCIISSLDQNIQVELLANGIVNNIYKDSLKNIFDNTFTSDMTTLQKNIAEGKVQSQNMYMIIGGVICCILIILIIFYILKK